MTLSPIIARERLPTAGLPQRAPGSSLLASAHGSPRGVHLCYEAEGAIAMTLQISPRRQQVLCGGDRLLGEARAAEHRWAIVLAGGNGTRLAAITREPDGTIVPKQYCSFQGERSLLGDALARAERLGSRERVVVVVASQHERFWRQELADRDPGNVVVQPENRGTAPGILLPLLSILARDHAAQVTLLPSDHFVMDEEALARELRGAQRAAEAAPSRTLVVGIEPDSPEPDYGWILPGPGAGPTRPVASFVEKPSRQVAGELMRAGAVWNSFLLVGAGAAILRLYEQRLAGLLDAFLEAGVATHPDRAADLYRDLADADFSRQVLAGSAPSLGLRVAPTCGWTDLGTPTRVARCASRQTGTNRSHGGSLAAAATAFCSS